MRSSLCLILVTIITYIHTASALPEADVLLALKSSLVDPHGILETWNSSTYGSPCRWYYVTCNADNSVIRIDLGGYSLGGQLVPQLGQLPNLQYLELYNNTINGTIPSVLGNLSNLVSLDLYKNNLTGPIPDALGNLSRLRFLRLSYNRLSGEIPRSLTSIAALQVIDLSNNQLTGYVPINGSFSNFNPKSFDGNPDLKMPSRSPEGVQSQATPSPVRKSTIAAIVGGAVVGVLLVVAA